MNSASISNPEQGYFIQIGGQSHGELEAAELVSVGHRLGGSSPPGLYCPACAEPVVALLELATEDARLDLVMLPTRTLPLMTCARCFRECFHYGVTESGDYFTFEHQNGHPGFQDDGVGLVPFESRCCLLHAIPDRIVEVRQLALEGRMAEAGDWVERFDWDQLQHQVGGCPRFVNRSRPMPDCFLCGKTMPFFASVVVSVCSAGDPVGSEVQVLFFVCRACRSVSATPDLPVPDYS